MEKNLYLREYIKYASLNVLGMIGLSCYILADTFFISKGLGANGLAALNLAIPVYSFIHGCGLMLGMGGATRYSICRCRKNQKETDTVFTNTVMLAVAFAVVFVLTGIFLSEPITAALGADQEIFAMTNTYLKVVFLFSPAFLMNNVCHSFIRNDGNPQLSMLAMMGGSMSNILLDYIFIFPLHMGIFGAVFATGLAPVISMGILSRHWMKKRQGFHLIKTRPEGYVIKRILALGFPSLITELSSGIVIIIFNIILLKLEGNLGVAAYGVVANLSLVIVSVYTGISQGMQPLLSKAYGLMDRKNIRQVLRYALVTVAVISCMVYAVIFIFADPIAGIFNSEHQKKLQEIAVSGLRWYFTSVWFVGFNIIISVYFTATDKAAPAQAISLLRGLFVIVPMAFLLSALWKTTGVWLAFPVTELLVAVYGFIRYTKEKKGADAHYEP